MSSETSSLLCGKKWQENIIKKQNAVEASHTQKAVTLLD